MNTPPVTPNVFPFPPRKSKRKSEDKWSKPVMGLGFTPLPNLLLRAQGKLKINPMQFNVLVQMVNHWWDADKDPYPAKDSIARRMGKSPRMVQRYVTQLEKKGFVKRVPRFNGQKAQTSNAYSLEGLVKKLQALEPEFTKEMNLKKQKAKKLETAATG